MVQHCYFAFSDHREAQCGSDHCQANYNEADIRFDREGSANGEINQEMSLVCE